MDKKKHVVVCCPIYKTRIVRRDKSIGMIYWLICVSVDSLMEKKKKTNTGDAAACVKSLTTPFYKHVYLNDEMSCIITTSRRLYSFGGLNSLNGIAGDHKVYSYDLDLDKFPKLGTIKRCKDMIYGVFKPLVAQVGHDSVYLLNYGNNSEFSFQEYNFKKNQWTLIDNVFDITRCVWDWQGDLTIRNLPHVVIGPKLHVSIGINSSFAFDTISRVWEKSKLFESFWLEEEEIKKKKTSGFSPSNFYGANIWGYVPIPQVSKKRKREVQPGGPPFGFTGRAIFWKEKNILLGLHSAPNCHVVAFQLDDDGIKVVKSQPLSLGISFLRFGPRLVDLGRDGYFGIVRIKGPFDFWSCSDYMDLVTFRVQVIAAARGEDFLKCQVVSKNVLAKDLAINFMVSCDAFCV